MKNDSRTRVGAESILATISMIMAAVMPLVGAGHRPYLATENDMAFTAAERQAGMCTFAVGQPSKPAVTWQSTAALSGAMLSDRMVLLAAAAPPPAAEQAAALRRLFLDK